MICKVDKIVERDDDYRRCYLVGGDSSCASSDGGDDCRVVYTTLVHSSFEVGVGDTVEVEINEDDDAFIVDVVSRSS